MQSETTAGDWQFALGFFRSRVATSPYCYALHAELAACYLHLGYPDIAIGSAYKAIMLSDAGRDDSDEYHELVLQQQDGIVDAKLLLWNSTRFGCRYRCLIYSLYQCSCWKTAHDYQKLAITRWPKDLYFTACSEMIHKAIETYCGFLPKEDADEMLEDPSKWPNSGMVRREKYVWNAFEPARLTSLDEINKLMGKAAPAFEVRCVNLPLLKDSYSHNSTSAQLGVFAKRDIAPNEIVLNETSMLTANNKLREALCEACSAELPELHQDGADQVENCSSCDAVFCNAECLQLAQDSYHEALCEKDVEAIAKNAPLAEGPDALYALLLLRSFAMALTQEKHPLELDEVKFLWGDFDKRPEFSRYLAPKEQTGFNREEAYYSLIRTLPFSFKYNVQLPFHMLEKMDIDIFENNFAEVWVFNTLYAKFRGVASARLSGGSSRFRGPDVTAVHPMWCLANHSCDPNVTWEWSANIEMRARGERIDWHRQDETKPKREAGIRKGEEIFNHYTDINLSVKERREWAHGTLGGDCQCERCVWEAGST
ncbi:hypothetical protein K431DRAFT_331714 [Polychaeton citri CBS 116435]|uniref:SET domain-containing protein n=1 Tax=Polychaeton citri CBS 116435 TaxID=1314669 RepID=A0A9P4Q6Z0_9PEZI|nr:hypothetical protein K431DRAFT_331714 [Polychaeton citri CBS 116435]